MTRSQSRRVFAPPVPLPVPPPRPGAAGAGARRQGASARRYQARHYQRHRQTRGYRVVLAATPSSLPSFYPPPGLPKERQPNVNRKSALRRRRHVATNTRGTLKAKWKTATTFAASARSVQDELTPQAGRRDANVRGTCASGGEVNPANHFNGPKSVSWRKKIGNRTPKNLAQHPRPLHSSTFTPDPSRRRDDVRP